ncbi:uncharacterized protein LTR77_009239 [Saxophila tyrrhenica]|uniref:Uncharacterized protein n=1 Tax=Saxophila tyrrhenica TaxID=1690608 RepID=A0AAV9P1X1_9PEZI|nr:hypothetical protein LTR77_009239 [Saxophila tyrrhenica]
MAPLHRRAPSRDAELGKRDDDYRPRTSTSSTGLPWRWRKRRVVFVLLGLMLVYLFIKNMPTDLPTIDERMGRPSRPGHVVPVSDVRALKEPVGAPPRSANDDEGPHYYNGPIKFYRLATTLRGISRTGGSKVDNRNVLFAASSLKSVANLIPMACAMAKADRNYVHLALLGRDALPLNDILEINGFDKKSCQVFFHDARGDYSEYSSETRAEVSVSGAMKHINDFIHAQAIVMDDSIVEDGFFTRAMRRRAGEYRRALIEVPAESSGGLIRLLKSLQRADYTGLRPPRLSIELPNDIEHFARGYIEGLDWPPDERASPLRTNALSLRHRITTSRLNSEQMSLRFVESFFPASTIDDHVLILSPQAEVDQLYLQYLYYLILEYRYSLIGSRDTEDLLGLSLDVPTNFINGSSGFEPPTAADMQEDEDRKYEALAKSDPVPFLYQAPSSTSSLIFGDKWTTFHNFLSRRLEMSETGVAEKHTKQVAETEPAWMEYLLELMTARGWNMLHPASPMGTVHNELARIPEEYIREAKTKDEKPNTAPPQNSEDEPFLIADTPPSIQPHVEHNQPASHLSLSDTLPFDGNLPDLGTLPHLYRNGKVFVPYESGEYQDTYLTWFRQHIGGCDLATAQRKRVVHWLSADDLFCVAGIPNDYDEGRREEEEEEGGDGDDASADAALASGEAAGAEERREDDEKSSRAPTGPGADDDDGADEGQQDGVQV